MITADMPSRKVYAQFEEKEHQGFRGVSTTIDGTALQLTQWPTSHKATASVEVTVEQLRPARLSSTLAFCMFEMAMKRLPNGTMTVILADGTVVPRLPRIPYPLACTMVVDFLRGLDWQVHHHIDKLVRQCGADLCLAFESSKLARLLCRPELGLIRAHVEKFSQIHPLFLSSTLDEDIPEWRHWEALILWEGEENMKHVLEWCLRGRDVYRECCKRLSKTGLACVLANLEDYFASPEHERQQQLPKRSPKRRRT